MNEADVPAKLCGKFRGDPRPRPIKPLLRIPRDIKQNEFSYQLQVSDQISWPKKRKNSSRVRIERLTGNEKPHDLARPFNNRVNSGIAHDTFYRNPFLPARFKRICGFITSSAPDLDRCIDNPPAGLRARELCRGRFQANIYIF